jgi:CTP synthase
MQLAVVEFARNALKLSGANSTEFDPKTRFPVIDRLPEQKGVRNLGGSMRLGSYPCAVSKNTLAHKAYRTHLVHERHRHRYELNNKFRKALEGGGLVMSGVHEPRNLVEIVELPKHPWFLAVQFHPEFKSRPESPHPLFADFIGACLRRAKSVEGAPAHAER